MPTAQDIIVSPARRRTLASLIDLYESNYYRLLRLVPELGGIEGTVVSRVAGALDLYLTVHERQRYTTTLSLTYRFGGDEFQPNACIVVYHDVHAAELVSFQPPPPPPTRAGNGAGGQTPDLDQKWRINRFLQKWLGFCHRQGHLFLLVTCHRIPDSLPLEPLRDPWLVAGRPLPAVPNSGMDRTERAGVRSP